MLTRGLARVLSRMCQFTAATLMISGLVGLAYGEPVWGYYAAVAAAALTASLGFELVGQRAPGSQPRLTRRESFLAVVLSWVVMIFFGALPFWLSGAMPLFADAMFESASGYTTTGATILGDIEALPHAHLFQRSLAHWVGGMGIIVLSVAILPELAVGGMQLFTAESTGISTDKLAPRIVSTARRLWWVYASMTGVLVVLLLFGGMNVFDAVTHAFGTLATGGFSTRNASIGAFDSLYIEAVITAFMIGAGVSFALQYRLYWRRNPGPLLTSREVRLYLGIFVSFSLLIAIWLVVQGGYTSFGSALRDSVFQTAAIITTTGYGTANFDAWPSFCRYLLVALMFLGGCAGSTAGGVKVIRLLVVLKHAMLELRKLVHPTIVQPVMIGDNVVPQATIQAILGFFLLYISTIGLGTALVLATGVDLVTGVTAVVSAMNSIGPGLGLVGPAENYSHMPTMCKWVLSACMLVGRLEIYTVIVLFTAAFWKH